jgi:hypothetical protein
MRDPTPGLSSLGRRGEKEERNMTKRGVNKTAIEKILKRDGYILRRSAGVWVIAGHGKRREFENLRAVAGMIQGRAEQEQVAALMEAAKAEEIIREAEAEWKEIDQDESEAEGEVNDECD